MNASVGSMDYSMDVPKAKSYFVSFREIAELKTKCRLSCRVDCRKNVKKNISKIDKEDINEVCTGACKGACEFLDNCPGAEKNP